ncbi:hypothetical protein MAR_003219 [Mya arenaria]|uniref:Uncharacterized protein n=1 Tax=Mya arenaria TaxID=6604 RepID=A0ABY7GEM6_MYAAR|nr:hypothetical protein MAR_003219 [Mya arenaria]
MAKTKAQRMKEYRARKKEQLGDAWLKRERERVKACYTPSALLTEEENAKRRGQNRKNAKTFYKLYKKTPGNNDGMNIRNTEANSENAHEPQQGCSGDNNVSSTTAGELMTVKMLLQFRESKSNEKKGPKKRQSRELKISYARIETLADQNETLKRKLKSAQKRIERFESTKQKEATTPESKTDALLKRAGLRPTDVPDIRKQLLYAECVNEEILNTMSENPKEMANLQKVISGKVIKKYRMRSYLENRSMVERRKVVKNSTERKRMIRSKAEKIKGDLENFLNRDDNSRVMPGKGDVVKVGAVRKQKKILNDYLHNLHLKFVSESDYKISKASFCRLRPKEVTLVNFTSRSVCLCARHQNMGFKLKSLKNMNVCSCTSPDGFVEMYKSVPVQFEILNHNASMVSAIITKTVEAVKKLVPNLAMIHFWTDSPSSQYRNRHGCRATWHYFESGHGKSACDGVGGTAKRNADMAVKQSKAVIQDAHDFFAWAISAQSEIEYQLKTPEEYQTCHEEVEKRKTLIKPLKGTMSLHAIATGKEGILYLLNKTVIIYTSGSSYRLNRDEKK